MSSTPKCAPSNNLNVGYPQFATAKELHQRLVDLTTAGGGAEFVVRNFVGVIQDISIEASTVVTDLFPKGALEYCTYLTRKSWVEQTWLLQAYTTKLAQLVLTMQSHLILSPYRYQKEHGLGVFARRV